jgi:Uma2 family endonuclease
MEQPIEDEVYYYYDAHPTEEDLMGEMPPHSWLVYYLIEVLIWLLRRQVCAVHENYNFYQTTGEHERPLVPDIALIRGVPQQGVRSYRIDVYGPPPQVVFEFASEETWRKDLLQKPGAYQRMGVEEYYAYDPNWPALPLSRRRGRRLFAWQRDPADGVLHKTFPDDQGRIWSPFLQSYLVPDSKLLRLTDRFGNRRLTQAEEEKKRADEERKRARDERRRADLEAKQAAEARERAEEERRRADEEAKRAADEARRADEEAKRANEERQRADEEYKRAERFAAILREQGIDPDQLA